MNTPSGRAPSGMRKLLAAAGLCVLAAGMSACASTEQESAKIARESQVAAAQAAPHHSSKKTHAHAAGSSARKWTAG